jgi:hypothetical protein
MNKSDTSLTPVQVMKAAIKLEKVRTQECIKLKGSLGGGIITATISQMLKTSTIR